MNRHGNRTQQPMTSWAGGMLVAWAVVAAAPAYSQSAGTRTPSNELLFVAQDVPAAAPQPDHFPVRLAAEVLPLGKSASSRSWLDIRPYTIGDHPDKVERGTLPEDISKMEAPPQTPRAVQLYESSFQPQDFCASFRFWHRPLYFEDRKLERYGISPGFLGHVPPVRSGVHFLGSFSLLPVRAWQTPPHRMVPTPCNCRCQ